ncbi:host cell division inhibitor Icd-like protein [Xenorhabdus stockiae]|uniref:host cell division inhibitor Icd-like protein n=1 Tax=Xenorhabdus stockiae TaxID=351614 RepID=UPI003CF46374
MADSSNFDWLFLPVINKTLFKWSFLVTERKNKNSQLQKYVVIAESYKEAKQIIAKNYIYTFAGKVPAN